VYRTITKPALIFLDGLWRFLVFAVVTVIAGGFVQNVATSLVTTGSPGISDPSTWAVARPVVDHPHEAAIFLGVVAVVAVVAYMGHRANGRVIPPDLQALFQVSRVGRTVPTRFVTSYHPFYIPRRLDRQDLSPSAPGEADEAARTALSGARSRRANPDDEKAIGICVEGVQMLGTTRLAWEAMRAELKSWTFMVWPDGATSVSLPAWGRLAPLLKRRRTRRAGLVLWLDDLARYTHMPGLVTFINSLPGWIEQGQSIPVIVMTTLHEREEHGPLHEKFAPLLERLVRLAPARITVEEARGLTAALTSAGQVVHFESERSFDGLPGSLVYGVGRMRDEVYPTLGQAAQLVLKAIKLLRSAGVTEYTQQRVIVAARDVFHLVASQIPPAIATLQEVGFLQAGDPAGDGQPTVAAGTEIYLDVAVPDYPNKVDAVADWPLLQESLEGIHDSDALARLAEAFGSQGDYERAERCYKITLPAFKRDRSLLDWAGLQYGLGRVLVEHATKIQEPKRSQLLEQAQDCFTSVLTVVNQQNDPEKWIGTLEAWRDVLRRQPVTTKTPAKITSIEHALAAAKEDATAAKKTSKAAWAEAQLNVGVLQFLQARFAQEAGARRSEFDGAIRTLEQVVADVSRDADPWLWVRAQSSLAETCSARALFARERRLEFLGKAADAYRAALSVPLTERTRHDEAELCSELGKTLAALAEVKSPDEQPAILGEAEQVLRRAIGRLAGENYRVECAEVRCVLGKVLGELGRHTDGPGRIKLLTQGIVEYEVAQSVLDPDGRDRGDEVRIHIAELLWYRAEAKRTSGDIDETPRDLSRVLALTGIVLQREGAKELDRTLRQLAVRLAKDAKAREGEIRGAGVEEDASRQRTQLRPSTNA